MKNRVNKFFGKDSPDLKDASDWTKSNPPKADPIKKDDGEDVRKQVAEAVTRNRNTVHKMVAGCVGPYMESVAPEFGPVSILSCITGIGAALADVLATVANQAGLCEAFQETLFKRVIEVTESACNDISIETMRKAGMDEETIKRLIAEAEDDDDNPADAISFDDIAKATGTPSKDDLRRMLGEIMDSLNADDEEEDDDDED